MDATTNNQTHDKRNMGASLIRRAFALVILAGAVTAGFLYWQHLGHEPTVVRSKAPQQAIPVQTLTLQPRTVPLQPVFLGQTEASQVVEIRSRVSGFLESKHFEEGGKVETGQLLFRIDPRSFQAELDLAEAQLASAQAQLVRARKKVTRYTELQKSNAATVDELEEWETEELVAQANIQQTKARITQAKLDLGYTTVQSPIDGSIGMALKDVGSFVDDSSNGLLAVVETTDPMYVRYAISEQDLLLARRMAEKGLTSAPSIEHLRLRLTLADGEDYSHEGKITYSDPQIDPNTGTMVMRGSFPNPDGFLRPGQFVHVHILGVDRLNALLVPKEAVIQNPTGAMVYVVNDQNKVEIRNVTLGTWQGELWILESGARAGDRVVINHLMQLRPGMAVIPQEMAPAAAQTNGTQSVEGM